MGLAAALALGGALSHQGSMLRPDEPRVREVRQAIGGKKMARRINKRLFMKRQRTLAIGKSKALKARDYFGCVVEKFTNHQRNQWARAGYPGLRGRDLSAIQQYLGVTDDVFYRLAGRLPQAGI